MSKRVSSVADIELWYRKIWHRGVRQDELDRHMKWRTPFSRLINWLVDETPEEMIGWHKPVPKELPWRISAYFKDPKYKKIWGFEHYGIDIPQPSGHPVLSAVLSAGQGVIEKVGFDDGIRWPLRSRRPFGNYVRIRHNKKFRTIYAHLEKVEVIPGWFVPSDYKLGMADSTGWSTGDHQHFEVHEKKWGFWIKIDPLIKIS